MAILFLVIPSSFILHLRKKYKPISSVSFINHRGHGDNTETYRGVSNSYIVYFCLSSVFGWEKEAYFFNHRGHKESTKDIKD